MMRELKDILYGVNITASVGDMHVKISDVCFDSRQVGPGSVFVAIKGTLADGHEFIYDAIRRGAAAIICEYLPDTIHEKSTCVTVKDSARALAVIASNFFGAPSQKLKLVGVTGTNGKTTVTTLLYRLFNALGYKTGLISTVEYRVGEHVFPATHTTPDPVQINRLLSQMVDEGCSHAFMEVSSHAIVQERVAGLNFTGGVFTNISHDHLDYHKTFENYIRAKKKFFDELPPGAFALVNADDKRGMVMLQNTRAQKKTYSLKKATDFKGKIMSSTRDGLEMDIDGRPVWFRLIGHFNAYNLLAVYATALMLGESPDEVLRVLSGISGAPGRFERIVSRTGVTAIVDYAHTPDALQNVLETIRSIRSGNEQIITVVGCGGNRDRTKRPLMASVAVRLSDKVILTSDNPRDEDPQEIIREMQTGITPAESRKTLVIVDREEAIKTACLMAAANDIVLIAGKGHETYQEIKGVKYPFDDREVVKKMFQLVSNT
jgi:UDP-N-acetylmuramoyl-L-alanyl-D-glutamate--2,6-diaminopimelate ligase